MENGWLLAATVQFYVQCVMIGIGLAGTAANAVVLYALILHNSREIKKRVINWLVINQNLLDLCCCVVLIIILSLRVSNIYLTGAFGYVLCAVLLSGNAVYCLLNACVVNLMTLTVERYLKVVFPFWSKKNLKSWMIYATLVFSWIAGILSMGPLGFETSLVVDGSCLGYFLYFQIPEIKLGYGAWNFLSFFLLPLVIFVYCYGHIVFVMRKQMRVMASHNVEASAQSASQAQSKRVKWNVIKTMIIVSAFFIVCWCPFNVYIMAVEDIFGPSELIGYIITLFLPYVNISLNPFIYATKHEGVRRILARMIVCHKHDGVAAVSGTAGTSSNIGESGTRKTYMTTVTGKR